MNGHQLKSIVDKDKYISRMLGGILKASDLGKICYRKGPPKAYIVNVGDHWTLLVFYKNKTVYFDSYGDKPKKSLLAVTGCVQQSILKLQPTNSSLCGLYVIFVLYYLARGVSFHKVLHMFYKKTLSNDKLVANFVLNHYGFDVQSEIKV